MSRILTLIAPAVLLATPALASGPVPTLPGPSILGLAAAAVVGGVYLARRRK
ncbi:hypothetical protein [Futiania mangrovi]|uniref:PEP-CTERM sorting domain-containing protein n=1 Tax=Futiania mangrovi TaxID=2959716 RepID=A0A9J6PJ33_9PROT|nr:hypothetical protein [Futiania mangrovii]MCP1337795.1 hypothetical protein [Futiania mangrovii]